MIVLKVPIRQYTRDELVSIRDVLIKKSGDKNVVVIPDDISVFLYDAGKEQLLRCREIIDCALAKYEEIERNEEHSDEHTTVLDKFDFDRAQEN